MGGSRQHERRDDEADIPVGSRTVHRGQLSFPDNTPLERLIWSPPVFPGARPGLGEVLETQLSFSCLARGRSLGVHVFSLVFESITDGSRTQG
jgi:hypothetical protein